MNSRCISSPIFVLGIVLLQSMFFTGFVASEASAQKGGNETDLLALLDLKNHITQDPLGIMKLWNHSTHFCNWVGITCNPTIQRVVNLNLDNQTLSGSIPPSIGNLSYLTGINLRRNSFRGQIPQEMGRLLSLQYMNFSFNFLGGKIPSNISHCTDLKRLDLSDNEIVGKIPDQLSSLLKLTHLHLDSNNLSGNIPSWIGNLSSLYSIVLDHNNFHGIIPEEFGRLTGLGRISVPENNISGMVPPSIYNISSIFYFSVTQNQLHGNLPADVGITLPNLQIFVGGVNKFTGNIPETLSNASKLYKLDFSNNGFTGLPPKNLGNLRELVLLNFEHNRLGSGESGDLNFLSSLVNCTSLEGFSIFDNYFGGELPHSIANLTNLKFLSIADNMIHGSIPVGFGNLVNLTHLGLGYNNLGGSVPNEIGKLRKLVRLELNFNNFFGPIPSSIGNLTSLSWLFMEESGFEGSIPASLGRCTNLVRLNLSSNNLNGTIPREVMSLSSWSISLVLSNNLLTGSLPSEVGNLKNLAELDVSGNKLSGEIPSVLGSCVSLGRLRLEENEFQGNIPQTLESLRGLEEMDLSSNNFSGVVPDFLSQFPYLRYLNLSYNNFEGDLPKLGVFSNASEFDVLGNEGLCGGIPELLLPPCSDEKLRLNLTVLIPVICGAVLVIIMCSTCIAYSMKYHSRRRPSSSLEDWEFNTSYFDLFEATDGFSDGNLIGSGSFGSVYKGLLAGDGTVVAIKVLNLHQQGASKSFTDECKALRSVRHRNLLKIITVCSSIDRRGNEFKGIVFQFMTNGSLDEWLHPRNEEQRRVKRLSLIQRLNIAIDVAFALEYLHHHCETPIVHCDLKPSNVLLDKDLVAHVGDFGLASFLSEGSDKSPQNQTISSSLKGSIGYIPPEYGMGGQVSILGDSYSYGILLLEMFTGKRPTDDMFKDGFTIHQFTSMDFPDNVMDRIDPSLLFDDNDDEDGERNENKIEERAMINDGDHQVNDRRRIEECLVSVMHIGLLCSNSLPRERLPLSLVVKKMLAIRDSYLNLV